MSPFECYSLFLALKQHFTKPKYDAIRYNWKVRASITAFHKRKDRYFFEKLSRKKNEEEVKNFYISNFVASTNPQSVYIPDLIKDGEDVYINWQKRVQSLSYNFKNEVSNLFTQDNFNDVFECKNAQHSILIKKYLQGSLSIETLVILEIILKYVSRYDKILDDPLWELLSLKITKYKSLLNIDIGKYLNILKETICE